MNGQGWVLYAETAWLALLSVAVVCLLYCLRRQGRDSAAASEALLYRIGLLEERLRRMEENHKTLTDELQWQEEQRRRLMETPPPAAPPEPTAVRAASPLEPRTLEILRRSRQGQSVLQIAQEMNLGQGEVQLVLALGDMRSET